MPDAEFVPVYIENLNRVLPKGEILPVPILCSVNFGEPLQLAAGETKHGIPHEGSRRDDRPPRQMSPPDRQTLWLFGGLFILLLVATLIGQVLTRHDARGEFE